MLNPFICGSFNHQQEEEDRDSLSSNSPCSTPRRSKKSSSNNKDSKNPYSSRGLDKFSALLAELEEKRQKIYSQAGSEDISFVRFVYSSSNEVVPVVVKLKDHNKYLNKVNGGEEKPRTSTEAMDKSPGKASVADREVENKQARLEIDKHTDKNKKKMPWNLKLRKWRRPSYYMPVFIILILLLLALFGRSVAILCTSIGWYMVPTLSSKRSASSKPANKKKQLVRRFSEISPKSKNVNYDAKVKATHGRQNSF